MERSVLLWCFSLVVLVTSTDGRVPVADVISNEIDKETEPKPALVLINITEIASLVNRARKPCLKDCEDICDNVLLFDFELCVPKHPVDNGTALLLTPYIEDGRTEEGRKASEVDPEVFLGIKSYSGFMTVNKTYDSNMFFWYFPVEKKPVNETPWIVWLQGGPGASSMTGLFEEIGPFKLNHRRILERNPYTWLQNHSLVFIENPVGTGYSYTNHEDGYAEDMATYSKHLYSTLKQMVQIYPELKTAPLYLAGESYAGKYVPSLGMEIHLHKDSPGGDINFKGMILGNAYVEPAVVKQVTKTFYRFGLLDQAQLEIVQPLNEGFLQDIAANRSVEAKMKWVILMNALLILSHQKQGYNFLRDELSVGQYGPFLARPDVKRALHVGNIEHSFVNITVNSKLAPDFLSSTRHMFERLLDHYQVLVYCGQLDLMVPCSVTSELHHSWKWQSSQQFLDAIRSPYMFRNRLSGYFKTGGGLTEVVIRGAGHMAPLDAPAPTRALVAAWTHGRPLAVGAAFTYDYIKEFIKNNTDTLLYL